MNEQWIEYRVVANGKPCAVTVGQYAGARDHARYHESTPLAVIADGARRETNVMVEIQSRTVTVTPWRIEEPS